MLREKNARIEHAYIIVWLQRHKRLPKLDRLTLKEPKPKQSWQRQYEIAEQWVMQAEKQAKLKDKHNGH